MTEHIEEFERLMNQKGFDEYFLTNASFPDKLGESLKKHLSDVLNDNAQIPPFHLKTYSLWNGEDRPHVKCDFKTRYDRTAGFTVEKLQAEYVGAYSNIPMKTLEIILSKNKDIPTQEQVNALIRPKRRRLKLK